MSIRPPDGLPAKMPTPLERCADALERIADAIESATQPRKPVVEELPDPLRAEYEGGKNQWGVAYHGRCPLCDSDYPANANGNGTCRQCGAQVNAQLGTVVPGNPPPGPPPSPRS